MTMLQGEHYERNKGARQAERMELEAELEQERIDALPSSAFCEGCGAELDSHTGCEACQIEGEAMNQARGDLENVGFNLEQTGGNCTAYVRRSGDGISEYITIQGSAQAPESLADICLVGTYDDEDGAGQSDDYEEASFAEIMKAIRNPSEEYHLLTLRLHNGLGK